MKWITLVSQESGEHMGLIEFISETNVQFWGAIKFDTDSGKYDAVAFSPDRVLHSVDIQFDSIEEAQTAIESFLFDNGIINEGDEVEYE